MKSVFRDDVLDGKVAFVTGGGSGICKGIARTFMAHGARTAIVGRKGDRLEAATGLLEGGVDVGGVGGEELGQALGPGGPPGPLVGLDPTLEVGALDGRI